MAFPPAQSLDGGTGHATIVIEAGTTSGALLTAEIALDLGRAVGAVPGNIDSPESRGANGLLHRTDVAPITDVQSALALIGLAPSTQEPALQPDEERIWRALPATSVEDLVCRASLPTSRCLSAIASLELSHAVTIGYDGTIRRNAIDDIS